MFGNSLRRGLLQLQWEISCMQFGIIDVLSHGQLIKYFVGTVYPWMVHVPFYLQNSSSSMKGQEKVSLDQPSVYIVLGYCILTFFVFIPKTEDEHHVS